MTDLKTISKKAGDELQIHYVSLLSLANCFLEGNSKNHDINMLTESIDRYSFQDPMKFDPSLNSGKGGIVAGNGRLEWLIEAQGLGQAAPRGIRDDGGDWFVPVVFGVEFEDENEAIAFSISHNLSALWGSGLDFLQTSTLFNEDLLKGQLIGLGDDKLPTGLNGGDLLDWLVSEGIEQHKALKLNEGDQEETDIEKQWGVIVFCDDEEMQVELIDSLLAEGKKCKALM